jgi:hypothetical protein
MRGEGLQNKSIIFSDAVLAVSTVLVGELSNYACIIYIHAYIHVHNTHTHTHIYIYIYIYIYYVYIYTHRERRQKSAYLLTTEDWQCATTSTSKEGRTQGEDGREG